MLNVSDGWKAAHGEMILPETLIEINYRISEPGLQELAEMSVSNSSAFSELPEAHETAGEKYSTLEWNAWGLDGSFEYFDGSPDNPGYVTNVLSGADAAYPELPTITINFDSVRTSIIPGLTIYWSETFDEWAAAFKITVYNGTTVVAETTISDNKSRVSTAWFEFQNFDRVVIEVLEWCLPHRRSRTMSVIVGIDATYRKADLLSFTHTNAVDLLSASLPKRELVFQIENSDDKWNPSNPGGAERYLMERQKVTLRYGMIVDGKTEWINADTLWLSEWNTPTNGMGATFTARDAVQFMTEKYTGITEGTLYEIAEAAFSQVSLDGGVVEYRIADRLKSIQGVLKTDSGGDYIVSNVLQMVAHAGCCVMYSDASGVVHIEPHEYEQSDYEISPQISYAYPEFNMSKPLKAVSVTYGDGTAVVNVGSTGEVQTVTNKLISSAADAEAVANAAIGVLTNRKTISGEYRADPRLESLDVITVHNKYATNTVVITDITLSTTGGGLRGRYTGRVIDDGGNLLGIST